MSSSAPTSGPRFAVLKPEQLNAAQKKTLDSILSGPRAAGDPGVADRLAQRRALQCLAAQSRTR